MSNVKWPEEVGLNTEAKMTAALATPDTDEAFRLKSIQRKWVEEVRLNTQAKITAALAAPDTPQAFMLLLTLLIQKKRETDMRRAHMSPAEQEVKNTEEFRVNGQHWAVAN